MHAAWECTRGNSLLLIDMKKKTYKISGMHCASCAMVIEGELEDVGVNARCSYAKETLNVEFDPAKVSEKQIEEVVAKSGYSVVVQAQS